MSLGFGALLRERHFVFPAPSPSHLTQPMRCVTDVRFLVFGSGEMGDGGKQLSSSWEAKQYPQWVTPLSLCW